MAAAPLCASGAGNRLTKRDAVRCASSNACWFGGICKMLSVSNQIAASFGLQAQATVWAQEALPRQASRERIVRLVPFHPDVGEQERVQARVGQSEDVGHGSFLERSTPRPERQVRAGM